MSVSPIGETATTPAPGVGWKTWLLVLAFYFASLSIATYPFVLNARTSLPGSLGDPLQHLWVMKWYRTCLLERRSLVLCPELQYPSGAPLGSFSPLHFESMLFIPLSFVIDSDVICFNLVWLFGMLTTGLATFLLIWLILRSKPCAAFGGLAAMLSGPMMLHAMGHLELIHLGCFPLFLVGWMRFIDQPGRRSLLVAAGLYVLVGLCAAYYVVFAMVPAALYVIWRSAPAMRAGDWSWVRSRLRWVAGFSALAVPALVFVFGNQLWAMSKGFPVPHPRSSFHSFSTPLWSYFAPTFAHRLYAILPFDPYAAANFGPALAERASYLGVVTLALVYYAAVNRVRFSRASYFWLLAAILVLLACGASWQIGSFSISLPALWLKKTLFAFKMIRVPSRFNLFVAVVAALLAAAGLQHLLRRLPSRAWRIAVYSVACAVCVADLSMVHFDSPTIPPLPRAYAAIRAQDPTATFVDVPQFSSGGAELSSVYGYWQSQHRGPTTAGYSGHGNMPYDNRLSWNSPFRYTRLTDPQYLRNVSSTNIEILTEADFPSYVWLYLAANRLGYVMLHHWQRAMPDGPYHFEALRACLDEAKVYEDENTSAYAWAKMKLPARPTLVTTDGWRLAWDGRLMRVVNRVGRLAVYIPRADQPLQFAFEGKSLHRPRTVRLVSGNTELARWVVTPDRYQLYVSGPFRLPLGLQEAQLVSDGEAKPKNDQEQALEWDEGAYSLRVSALNFTGLSSTERSGPEVAEKHPPVRR